MLCALYDKQISQLRKSNAILKNNLIKRLAKVSKFFCIEFIQKNFPKTINMLK